MPTGLSHHLSLAPQGRELCFQAGLVEGALACTTLASHSPPSAAMGRAWLGYK